MSQPFDVNRAKATWLRKRAEQLETRRGWLLWAPVAVLPMAGAAGFFVHPLLGGAMMAVGAVLWLFAYTRNIDTTSAIGNELRHMQDEQKPPDT